MKNLNLIKRLLSYSHEKQKMRSGRRYAAILIMLLTLGVGQMWADLYVPGLFGNWGTPKNIKLVDRGSNVYSAYFQLSAQKYTFKINNGSWGDQNDYNRGKNDSGHPSVGTAYSMKKNGGNMEVTISTAGLYLFSVNTSTWKLTITQVKPTEAAPSNVVSGTNVMFYIQGYNDNGADYLTNGSAAAATSYPMNFDPSYSYVNTAKTNLSTYNHVSDNPTGWSGITNSNISNATGGELFVANGSTSKTAAKTLTTHTTSMSGDVLTITTKTSGTTGSCCSMPLYIQYYIDGTFAGVTYSAATASYASIKATGSNQTATYNCSSLTNGTHVLKTVLTDGLVYYVAASDNFTVAHTYSITYKDEGNSDYSGSNLASLPSSYTYGTGIATLTDGVRAGYSFVGWYDTKECDGYKITSISSSATGNKTFYAKWTAASTATLTYHANWYTTGTSGDVPDAQTVAVDATATVAGRNTLAMTNYTFSGWNTEQYITGTHYDAGDDITMDEDKDLYAVWTRSITLNQNGATTNGTTSVTGTYNCSTLPSITNPQKTGYTFVGWRTENNGTGNLVINTSGQLQSNVYHWTDRTTPSNRFQRNPSSTSPLYATWTQDITLNANTSNHGSGSNKTGTVIWNGTSITISTHCSAATGYSLDGYYTAATGGTKIINADKSFAGSNITVSGDPYISSSKWVHPGATTLYAQYTAKQYTITFDRQSGSSGTGNATVHFNNNDFSVSPVVAPTRTGYTFGGYYTGTSGSGEQIVNASGVWQNSKTNYLDGSGNWIYADNKTLYAKWTEIKYTVTLVNATAGSVSAGCATHPSITASTAPFGMKFDHWDVSGGASVASTTSNPTTVSATAAGTVTAVYTQGLYAYIVCRFETHSKDRQTTYYTGNWNTTATNNEFEYDEANHRFVKHTYTTLAELSANKDGQPQYFEVKTTEAHGNLDHSSVKYYGKSSNTNITTTGYDNRIAMELSEATGHPKFSGSTTDKYVVIYFDENKELWFEEEDIPAVINNISLSDNVVPPGASITATPSMYVRGAVNKAYCWGVYTDEECTEGNKVDVSFNSIGGGKVDFTVPLTTGTYYLKLKVHASAACDVAVDDSKVVSFEVTTTKMIYFKNVPNWSNVYVYFYYGNGASGYWNSSKGTGPMKGGDDRVCSASTMKRIGKSDIYYYQYDTWSGHVVAFADHVENDNEFFDQSQVAYREDFSTCAQMYVPENYIHDYLNQHDTYRTCYYSSNNDNKIRGYWTTYPRVNAGFTIKLYGSADGSQEGEDIAFTQTGTNTYVANVNLDPATHATYYYDLHTCAGDNGVSNTKYTHYGNSGEMKINSSDNWNFYTQIARCRITPAAAGTYKFKLLLSDDGAVQVSVEYPLAVGDYRLVYTDEDHTLHPSRFIRARADGLDTISVWINPDAESPVLKVQQCTAVSPKIIWSNYNWSGSDATGAIDISGYSRGVYNFYLTQNGSNELSVETSKTAPYTGLYYIRCSSVGGGWLGYKTNSDNLMTYTKYAEDKTYGFNYYKAKWVNDAGSDVTYTIACDYSESLCDTLVADAGDDPLNASQAVSIPHNANIRFGWNSLDNTLQRAYINGSTNASDRYLVLKGEHDKIVDENGNAFSVSGLNADETTFVDLNNWIYRVDLKAKPNGGVKVIANYNGNEQFFIGDADNFEKIIGSSEDQWWPLRVTYDFKTNRLMTAWLPSGSQITSNIALNADMMLIREGQNAATQVFFNGSGKAISDIHTIYGVMEFQYDNIVGKFPSWSSPNAYKYLMYYISFPFDVKVSEIFGCGVRGENWIVQKYNGAKRARIGWFAETSTFWETMEGSETMNAYEGYLLLLDRISFNDSGSSLWFKQGEGNSIYLYFPSTSVASGTISEDETTIHVPEHTCTIDRTFDVGGVGTVSHKNTDSHWNVIGTPLFEDKEATTIATPSADGAGATTLQYYYAWNSADNTLAAQAAFDDDVKFKSMHGYMVQYAGDVTFSGAKLTPPPASVAARRIPGDKKNYRIKLRMMNEDGNRSETFVELRENACDTFALNEDMYMMRSSTTVDLYTFAGAYDVAANVLSMNNHIVPVGMDVKRAGTYRFTMPSDFSGTVTLIDTEADVRTNLALGDYEVKLPKGTSNNRFFLEINIHQMPTAIDGVGGSLKDGKAHKFIENGQMYILQNGAIYDARGNRVR